MYGQALEPGEVLVADDVRRPVEGVAGGVVIERVVHAPGHRGVVVAQQRGLAVGAHQLAALVHRGSVADHVAQAHQAVHAQRVHRAQDLLEGLDVRVDVGDDADPHGTFRLHRTRGRRRLLRHGAATPLPVDQALDALGRLAVQRTGTFRNTCLANKITNGLRGKSFTSHS